MLTIRSQPNFRNHLSIKHNSVYQAGTYVHYASCGGEKGRGLVLKYTTIYEQKDGQVYIDSAVQ